MANVDPIRKFIWDIGNGTSENSLCSTLEQFFHTVCPLVNVLDQEICHDYKNAYEARCSSNSHRLAQEGTFLYIAIVLIFCLVFSSFLKAKRFLYIPDSAVTICVGFVTGALFVVSSANHRFNEQIFFEILLPFIIFESGYNMDKRLLADNFGLISTLAILGTFISFAVTSLLMKLGNEWLKGELSDLDCAMFGALISSTDPIAIVNVFSSLGVDPRLYALVLGESALNDGVAVALYASMKHFYSNPDSKDIDAIMYALSSFLEISLGSISLGFVFGLVTAYFWKKMGKHWFVHPVLETLTFLVCAILPYYVADALNWSGVIAIMAASMALSIYCHPNLSKTAQLHVVFVVECIARLCEAVMFGYVGTQIIVNNINSVWNDIILVGFIAVLLGRAFAVFPILTASNLVVRCRHKPQSDEVPLNQQVVVWFSGLRGALSFALAVTVPEYDTVLQQGSKHYGEILACTCFVIVMNVFVMGGIAPFVLSHMKVVRPNSDSEPFDEHSVDPLIDGRTQPPGRGLVAKVHRQYLLPYLTNQAASDTLLQDGGQNILTQLSSPIFRPDGNVNEPVPDENGFIHVLYDDETGHLDERERSHSFLFPRSRMALVSPPKQKRQISGGSQGQQLDQQNSPMENRVNIDEPLLSQREEHIT
jgi:NhaP-type Na+/H+ or K+/H+ antiporter